MEKKDYDALIEEKGTGAERALLRSRTREMVDQAENLRTLRELAEAEERARSADQAAMQDGPAPANEGAASPESAPASPEPVAPGAPATKIRTLP